MSGANTLALVTETIAFNENFLRNMGSDDHVLVAEFDGKVVGMVESISSKVRGRDIQPASV